MEKPDVKIKGELSEQELKDLLIKYPESTSAVFETSKGEIVVVYLKRLEREVFVAGNKFMNTKDELTTGEYLLKNLWIAGYSKEEIIKDWETLANCSVTIIPLLYVKAGVLKKN